MNKPIIVGISDQNITTAPGTIITYALGSCVGICLFDPLIKLAGMAHVLLPSIQAFPGQTNILKFADSAIVELTKNMENMGAKRVRMTAKIAGGARMFGGQTGVDIGMRNISETKNTLSHLGIRIVAEDTGLNYGRTIEFDADTGSLLVKSLTMGSKVI